MTQVVIIIVVVVAALALWQAIKWMRVTEPVPSPNVVDSENDPLLATLELLTRRVTVAESIINAINRILVALAVVAAIALATSLIMVPVVLQTRHTADVARSAASQAQKAIDQAEVDRKANKVGSCIQFNINQENTREAIINGLVNTFRPLVQPGREADFEKFAKSLRENVEGLLPYRDCSDDGIERFLKNPPVDPAVTTTTTVLGG